MKRAAPILMMSVAIAVPLAQAQNPRMTPAGSADQTAAARPAALSTASSLLSQPFTATIVGERPLSERTVSDSNAAAAAAAEGEMFVAWTEGEFGAPTHELKVARVGHPDIISPPLGQDFVRHVSIATNGENALVTWLDQVDLRARLVAADGSVGATIILDESWALASVVWNGHAYVLFTTREVIDIAADGAVVARRPSPFTKPNARYGVVDVRARFHDDTYYVVVSERPPCFLSPCPIEPTTVQVWRFDRNFVQLAPPRLLIDEKFSDVLDVATSGGAAAVLWSERTGGDDGSAYGWGLFVQRLRSDGSLLDAVPLELAREDVTRGAIAGDHGAFVFSYIGVSGDQKQLTFGRIRSGVESKRLVALDSGSSDAPVALATRGVALHTVVYPRVEIESGMQRLFIANISTTSRRRAIFR